ncbi:MAG: hypothetical protein MK102_05905 [Fuerstiella sp.]|nr:hypothetical protein [Fuerstiella sp.]
MSATDLLFDCLSEQNLLVLQSYAARSLALKTTHDEHDGWLERLETIDSADPEQLTQIHGELIALGMLKFEVSNRHTGLRYRVSDRGYAVLQTPTPDHPAESAEAMSRVTAAFEPPELHRLSDVT